MKNKPYDKTKNTSSLGSDLTTAIQNFHYSGEMIEEQHERKKLKSNNT
jgi:hypothetical protein